MPVIDPNTPIVVGVGEASERIEAPDYAACSPVELASRAARAALEDAGATHPLAPALEVIAAIRQFEVSDPRAVAPFGKTDNFPRGVARRIGADPVRAILEPVGGQGPQHLLNEMAQAIADGKLRSALLVGAEAISTVRHLIGRGEKPDWSEAIGGQLEERGFGLEGLSTEDLAAHGARSAIQIYALLENARRARRGLDREAYRLEMGRLFAPFTQVAASNPHAMSRAVLSPEALAQVTADNRIVADPFPRRVVSRDQANQGAAVLLMSVSRARELGVPESRWVYLHGAADTVSRPPMLRPDLSAYEAGVRAVSHALAKAGIGADDVTVFDFYSCFPIAVFSMRDGLGIAPDDPRPLTVTGGLPFFGGAGNNYSMHAIAGVVRAVRADRSAYGLVAANGGFLSKCSVAVYSARPRPWPQLENETLQREVEAQPVVAQAPEEATTGSVETYMIDYGRDPVHAVILARTERGERFVAMTGLDYPEVLNRLADAEPLGARLTCAHDERGRRIVVALG